MAKNPDRNYEIAAAVAAGVSRRHLAEIYGVKPTRIREIAKEYAWMVDRRDGRQVPVGLTVRAAIAVENAIGIWPAVDESVVIDQRRMEIRRSHYGRRVIMEDIDSWLAAVSKQEKFREPEAINKVIKS